MMRQFLVREDVMKRLSLAFLVVLSLVLAFTPLMSAYAEVQLPAYIKFKGYALGSCAVWYGDRATWGQIPPLWYGLASGSIGLDGYAKATSYDQIPPKFEGGLANMYGKAYFAAPGDVKALGFLTLKWLENGELHQLWIAMYSKPTTQGIFQPKTDKFIAGYQPPDDPGALGWENPMLGYRGIYKVGSNLQYLNGPITVLASEVENPPSKGIETILIVLHFGDYIMTLAWYSETITFPFPNPVTIPAARIVRDVELL